MTRQAAGERSRPEPVTTAVRAPEVTPRLREQAKQAPNSWVYVIDPAFEDIPSVPAWAVIGAYRVDGRGEIADEYEPNPGYRPTPTALGFSAPADEPDRPGPDLT